MGTPYLGTTGVKRADKILKSLGDKYRYQVIDGENCIYRKINNFYDVEISGTQSRKYEMDMTIYLWELDDSIPIRTVEIIPNIKTVEQLKETLETLETSALQSDLQPVSLN